MPASLRLLFLGSLLGTAACAAAHVLTFADVAFYPVLVTVPLLFVIFPLVLWKFRGIPKKNFFSEIFGEIPRWMKIGGAILLVYTFANFLLCVRQLEGGNARRLPENRLVLMAKAKVIRDLTPAEFRHAQAVEVRLMTGHLFAFFAFAAFATHACWLKSGPAMATAKIRSGS
ncbi:MAG: hypothetical protein H7343_13240 [Undibacterium sp.]|nr:hypothetical protein [Opitutaceae bacterium]